MKLSDLRKCDSCGGEIGMNFYVYRVSHAFVNPHAVREFMGLGLMLGGSSDLAEAFSSHGDRAVVVAGDEDPTLRRQLIICQNCNMSGLKKSVGRMCEDRVALEQEEKKED